MTLSQLLGLDEPVPTCAGGSILLQPDNTGESAVVLDKASEQLSTSLTKREYLWMYWTTSAQVRRENDPFQNAARPAHVWLAI